MKEPIITYLKHAEPSSNKIRIPKKVIEKFGGYFYMQLYDDKIVLIPIKKNKEK